MAQTLLSQVRALTGSSTTITSNDMVVEFLSGGARFLINSTPKELLWFAVTETSDLGRGYIDTINPDTILGVYRNDIPCSLMPRSRQYGASVSGSLHEPTARFPEYYIFNKEIRVFPAATTSSRVKVVHVSVPTITSTSTSTNISDVDDLINPMVLYAAGMDAAAMAGDASERLRSSVTVTMSRATSALDAAVSYITDATYGISTTSVQDALNKARYIIDSSSELSAGQDVEYYINDEDTEMMESSVGVAAQELSRAVAELRLEESVDKSLLDRAEVQLNRAQIEIQIYKENDETSLIAQECQLYLERSNNFFAMAKAELSGYIQNNSKMISLGMVSQSQGQAKSEEE